VTLEQLPIGATAKVVSYRHDDDALLQRILEMGVSRGIEVKMLRVAPLGDPMEIQLRGYQLSVRRSEARLIEVEPTEGNGQA
jgi:ferrous iron transport protein A